MRSWKSAAGAAVIATLLVVSVAQGDGHVRVVIPFDLEAGEVAEGVAVDAEGNVYTGISKQGRFVRLTGGAGEPDSFLVIPGLGPDDFGLVGLAAKGSAVFSAVVSADPDLNGVVWIEPETGAWGHIEGTEAMAMANAIALDDSDSFDDGHAMYVSDTIMGAVWRLPFVGFVGYAEPEAWIVDPLLAGTNELPYPFPIGANGLVVKDDTVYVANTEQATVVGIPINEDHSAGQPFVAYEFEGIAPDGIAFDAAGNLYVADPPAHILWKVTPDGERTIVADADDGLAGPSSVALHTAADGTVTAYVSNQAIGPQGTVKHGPSILAVTLGS